MPGESGTLRKVTLNALRIVTGFLFMQHGLQKIFGLLGGNVVDYTSLMGLAGFLELGGGVLIAVGLFTRPVAFVVAGEMATAYFMAHAGRGFWPIENGGERAALFCFIFLYIAARGGGGFSLDGWWSSRGRGEEPAPASAGAGSPGN